MARPLRIEFPGALYHITSRGNKNDNIFLDDFDRHSFLIILSEVIVKSKWVCHAYCLMNNHYHLMIETPDGNLSKGMRNLNGIYTQRFNFRHDLSGHLFQGRFKAILVEKDSYLTELSRYIVLNPIRAGLVNDPADWPWSSYLAMVGMIEAPSFLKVDWLLSQFGKERGPAISSFIQFIADGFGEESPYKNVRSQVVLGGNKFLATIKPLIRDNESVREIPRNQRFFSRPDLSDIFKPDLISNKSSRDDAVAEAYFNYGYTLKEIADILDVHYTTVSKIVRKVTWNKSD